LCAGAGREAQLANPQPEQADRKPSPPVSALALVTADLEQLASELLEILNTPDASARVTTQLQANYAAAPYRVWELSAQYLLYRSRAHEALAVFWALYERILQDQVKTKNRSHKGAPLVFISDCFLQLGFPVHAKRYLMLALCEDALQEKGEIDPQKHGVYFRLVWQHGHTDAEVRQYARDAYDRAQKMTNEARLFPEAVLQNLEDDWLIEVPSPSEASGYRINTIYARYLLERLGEGTGQALESLAAYLMSCMPGCRVRRRSRTKSTDYDLVCAMEGFDIDFRSEFGRYFVCECKDWSRLANFTVMAKFCRVLDSTKARFGILFSKNGISGAGKTTDAEREQLKVFQDRGIVIIVLGLADLERVASGFNLVSLLRRQYETVRLDLTTPRRRRRKAASTPSKP